MTSTRSRGWGNVFQRAPEIFFFTLLFHCWNTATQESWLDVKKGEREEEKDGGSETEGERRGGTGEGGREGAREGEEKQWMIKGVGDGDEVRGGSERGKDVREEAEKEESGEDERIRRVEGERR